MLHAPQNPPYRSFDLAEHLGNGAGRFVTIRRATVLQDAFRQLHRMGPALKSRVRIHFINEYGVEEAGVDGGGIFKEFVELMVQQGFSPRHSGLFKARGWLLTG